MDADYDGLSAVERWVEEGKPPGRIGAVECVNDTPALGVARTWPLCA